MTEYRVYFRRVPSPHTGVQWATVCAHPDCGRTISVDLTHELAEYVRVAHLALHAAGEITHDVPRADSHDPRPAPPSPTAS